MSRSRFGSLSVVLVVLLVSACGRIGVHLLPQSDHDARPADSGPTIHDAGPADSGSTMHDAGQFDAGPRDAAIDAGGTDAAMYDSCQVECRNDHGTAECTGQSCSIDCAIEIGRAHV